MLDTITLSKICLRSYMANPMANPENSVKNITTKMILTNA